MTENLNDSADNILIDQEIPGDFENEIGSLKDSVSNIIADNEEIPAKKSKTDEHTITLNLFTPNVCNVLDRINLTDGKGTLLLAEVAKTVIQQIKPKTKKDQTENLKVVLKHSRSTLRRSRLMTRNGNSIMYDEKIKNINVKVILQWDGKQYTEMLEKNEYVAVLVVGNDVDLLLGVLKLHSGTGKNQADGIMELVNTYKIKDKIVGMCFDTCAVNTGCDKGTCVLIEEKIGKSLLNFACRHHVFELVLKAAFEKVMAWEEVGPEVPLFKVFQNEIWNNIDKTNYKSCIDDPLVPQKVKEKKNNLLEFAQKYLMVKLKIIKKNLY